MNSLRSKQSLIDEFNKKNVMNIHETDVKYVIIRFDTLGWCKFEPLECIFAEEDTFEEFNKALIQILKEKYPIEAETITDIEYSLCQVVSDKPIKNYVGKVYDKVRDNDILFIAWVQRTEWRANYLSIKPNNE